MGINKEEMEMVDNGKVLEGYIEEKQAKVLTCTGASFWETGFGFFESGGLVPWIQWNRWQIKKKNLSQNTRGCRDKGYRGSFVLFFLDPSYCSSSLFPSKYLKRQDTMADFGMQLITYRLIVKQLARVPFHLWVIMVIYYLFILF